MVDILHRVGIKSSPDAVYKALTTRDGLAAWWTDDTQGEGAGRRAAPVPLRRRRRRDRRLRHEGARAASPTGACCGRWSTAPRSGSAPAISWDLTQEGDYVIVLFKHQGWKEPVEFMHHCSTKWAIFLMSLKSLVETGKGAPNPDDVKIDNWN